MQTDCGQRMTNDCLGKTLTFCPNLPAHISHQTLIIVAAVSLEFGIVETNLVKPHKAGRHLRFARQVAMYLAHIVYELNHTQIGRLFSKDRSTVSHACKVVEDSREDGVFDMKLIRLENFLRQAPRPVLFEDVAA